MGMVLPQEFPYDVGTDDADEADHPKIRPADGGNQGRQQQRNKTERPHFYAQASSERLTPKQGIVTITQQKEDNRAQQDRSTHDRVGQESGPSEIPEAPYHRRAKPNVGRIELENRGPCRPNGPDRDPG